MRIQGNRGSRALACLLLVAGAATVARGGGHTWRVHEMFSNADGTIQFIELREAFGGAGEVATAGHQVTSNSSSFTIPSNVAPPTSFKHILLGTAAFAALPGAPPVDYTIPANFFSTGGDTIRYIPYHTVTFGAGALPTDGVSSLDANLTTGVNSPTNYAGQSGSVNASPGPPGVPDGDGGTTPLTAVRLDPAGSSISVSWDDATCSTVDHHIVWGQGTDLPPAPGAAFGTGGGVCAVGASSPYTWNAAPSATDGTGLIWWLVLATDGASVEGSWGRQGDGTERVGPGPDGSSGECGVTDKATGNTCGQ